MRFRSLPDHYASQLQQNPRNIDTTNRTLKISIQRNPDQANATANPG